MVTAEITKAKIGAIKQTTITDFPIDNSAMLMTEDTVIKVSMNKEMPQMSEIPGNMVNNIGIFAVYHFKTTIIFEVNISTQTNANTHMTH